MSSKNVHSCHENWMKREDQGNDSIATKWEGWVVYMANEEYVRDRHCLYDTCKWEDQGHDSTSNNHWEGWLWCKANEEHVRYRRCLHDTWKREDDRNDSTSNNWEGWLRYKSNEGHVRLRDCCRCFHHTCECLNQLGSRNNCIVFVKWEFGSFFFWKSDDTGSAVKNSASALILWRRVGEMIFPWSCIHESKAKLGVDWWIFMICTTGKWFHTYQVW